MKKLSLILAFFGCVLFALPSQAQNFNSAVGLRLGYPWSVTYKKFISESSAIEVFAGTRGSGILGSGYRWYSVSAAYQIHRPIEELAGLDYYFGAGASAYFWNFDFATDAASTNFGIQAYGGLSYTFDDMPLNVSIDWIPTFFLNGYNSGFGAGYGSLAIRYVLSGGSRD